MISIIWIKDIIKLTDFWISIIRISDIIKSNNSYNQLLDILKYNQILYINN